MASNTFNEPENGNYNNYIVDFMANTFYKPDDWHADEAAAIIRLFELCTEQAYCFMKMDELNRLLQRYPNAVRSLIPPGSRLDDGTRSRFQYPLHVACNSRAPKEFIERLVREWPESIQVPCSYTISEFVLQDHPNQIIRFLWPFLLDDYDPLVVDPGIEQYKQAIDDHDRESILQDDMIYALPSDLAYATDEILSCEVIDILTNHTPPLHFICTFSRTPWIPTRLKAIRYLASVFPHDSMLFYQGMLPFHCACLFGAPRAVLEWWYKRYPKVVSTYTKDTHASPLHYYLASNNTSGVSRDSYFSAVQFLVEKHPDALHCMNHMGLLPFHVAAINDADLDVLFYLACQKPEALFHHHASPPPPPDHDGDSKPKAQINRKRKVSDLAC